MHDPASVAAPDPTLEEWLAARAHAVSTRRLAADVGGGGAVAAAAALWRPPAWPALVGAGLCFVAFGAWATAERRLRAGAAPADPAEVALAPARDWRPAWRLLRGVAGVAGTLAATLTVFAVLFGVLGRFIS